MNNTQDFNNDQELEEDMLPEYNFDYSKARSNRFAAFKDKNTTVKLEPDVAKIFKTSEDVNKALRAIISAIPKS
ncbi:MAG: hypothetical protein HC939_10580 [Pleurocapsa sp. SU_5_0]|jgi:hypothetical protein|nr:hypothetical protein [Pleurocapsa sp. SU_5_0]NJR46306.1 hypothetical protein [Hyellaceae cyanobacterium CSU_1_1]